MSTWSHYNTSLVFQGAVLVIVMLLTVIHRDLIEAD